MRPLGSFDVGRAPSARGLALAVLLSLAVAGCSGTNPFWVHKPEPKKDAAMLSLPDSAGIVVLPITGLGEAQESAMATALVDALQDANIPAEAGEGVGNRGSRYLTSGIRQTNEGSDSQIDLRWNLLDHDGSLIGSGHEVRLVPSSDWQAGAHETMAEIADRVAPEVAGLIQLDVGTDVAVEKQKVHFAGIPNAPGDGPRVLPPLVNHLLQKNGYEVAGASEGVAAIEGDYSAEPAPHGMEKVSFTWRVVDSAGMELGVVNQENIVPRGSLDGKWGDAAFFIAEGAIQGVHALLQARAEATASRD